MKKVLFAILALSATMFAQRTDTCSTTANTALGSNWTMVQCIGRTNDTTQGTSASVAMPSNVTSGNLLISGNGQCNPNSGGGCPAGSFTSSAIYNSDSIGSVSTGKVNTSGTKVTLSSGLPFGYQGCLHASGCLWGGGTITINGTAYTVSSVQSITSLTLTTSAGTQTAVSYSGPAWGCTETSSIPGVSTSICWATAASSAADTITVTGPNNYSLSESIAEFSNSGGIGSVDASSCPISNCGSIAQTLGTGATSYEIVGNLSATGELMWVQGNFQSGTISAGTGFTPIIMGKTNETQPEVKAVSGSGVTTGVLTTNTGSTSGNLSMIAFSSGATTATAVPAIGSANQKCWHSSNTTWCDAGGTDIGFANPLTNPSVIVACAVYTGTAPTPSDTAGNSWSDWGPGQTAFSASSAFIKCFYTNNTHTTLQDTISWSQTVLWVIYAEFTGLATSAPVDGGSGTGYNSAVNATSSGTSLNIATGGVKTATVGDLLVSFYSPFNGPPGAVGTGFTGVLNTDAAGTAIFGGGALFYKVLASIPAIARDGTCVATATSCTFTATAANDIKVVYAYRSGSTTAPSLPSGWTTIQSGATATGGTPGSYRIGCNTSSSGSDTGSGTWTNATAVVGASYSGAKQGSTGTCLSAGIGGTSTNNAKTSTTASYNTITMTSADNTSWVAGFLGSSGSSTCTPTNMTGFAGSSTNAFGNDTNTTASSWPTTTCTVTSETWMSHVDEILAGINPIATDAGGTGDAYGGETVAFKVFVAPPSAKSMPPIVY